MKIIVGRGREKATQRIDIKDPTVSREHCWLTDNGDGTYTLEHKSATGFTIVDGRKVLKTKVTPQTQIKLSDTTTVKVADLLPLKPVNPPGGGAGVPVPIFSLINLGGVWATYEEEKRKLAHKQHSLGLLVRIPMIFTAITGVLSYFIGPIAIIFTVISAIIMVYGFIQQSSFVYQDELENLNKWMMDYYVCPNPKCKHFLGLQHYKVLRTNRKCHYCGCQYTDQ